MSRFHKQFQNIFFLRCHMFLLLLATACSGIIANKFLYAIGLHFLFIRYPASALVSYVIFIIIVRIWLIYVRAYSTELPAIGPADRPSSFGRSTARYNSTSHRKGSSWDVSGADFPLDFPGDEAGCLIVLLLIIICFIFGGAAFLIYEAPIILTEAAFEFFLAAGLIRSLQKLEQPDWTKSILATTWKPFAATIVLSFLFGILAHINCPYSATIKEVIFSCTH